MKNVCIIGVGGGCGTAVTPLINEYIRSLKIPIVSIVQRPFKFEGKKRSGKRKNKKGRYKYDFF